MLEINFKEQVLSWSNSSDAKRTKLSLLVLNALQIQGDAENQQNKWHGGTEAAEASW